jgi:hypothetical protein
MGEEGELRSQNSEVRSRKLEIKTSKPFFLSKSFAF